MTTKLVNQEKMLFNPHPKFSGVQMAIFVNGEESVEASVCMLKIEANTEIPIHTHDPQVDSIFIVAGQGEAYVNGSWQPIAAGDYLFVPATDEHGIRTTESTLTLFVHHSPPLL